MTEVDDTDTVEATDVSLNNAVTPHYNEPEDADRYPVAVPNPVPAHQVTKGNPEIDGPYLDDVREAEAQARRDNAKKAAAAAKKAAKDK